MKRLTYILSLLSLFVMLFGGCSSERGVTSIYSVGIYDVKCSSEYDFEVLEDYLRFVQCPFDRTFVVEGRTIQDNNRLAVEMFRTDVAKIDYRTLRQTLSGDVTFTYAVVCGSDAADIIYLDSEKFSPEN